MLAYCESCEETQEMEGNYCSVCGRMVIERRKKRSTLDSWSALIDDADELEDIENQD